MSKLVRIALYTLSSKQGREVVFSILTAVICAIILPIILIGGFASSYITVFGGEADDVYVQAVNEVKADYEIENSFEPALLRAIYFNKYETTETSKSNVRNTIEKYFIRSEELPRTVSKEDIALLQEQVDETEKQLLTTDEQCEVVKHKISALNNDIDKAQNKVSALKDLLNLLENQTVKNEFIINFYTNELAEASAELNSLLKERQNLTKDLNDLSEKSSNLHTQFNEFSDKLQEAKDTYANEPIIVYYFLELEEIKAVLLSAPFSYDDSLIEEVETLILIMQNYDTVDFSDITFDNETANDTQKQIVKVSVSAADYGIIAVNNQCEAWVADIYQKVLGSRGYAPSAIAAGRSWSVSSDWSRIQVGAAVYGTSSNQYGHVGIYIGGGLVIHNLNGYVKTETLESWVKSYNGKCWGWENGKNLTGDPQYKCIGGLI
ncbi:MAG: hypothetical protein K2M82_03580 [Lachnospiraceae bacterium]|nr:hypothetical protein [Lachnospiraceae bacterium]